MQKEAEKFGSSALMEGMVSIRAVIRAREDGKSDRRIEEVLFDRAKSTKKARELAYLYEKAPLHSFSVRMTDASELDALCIGTSHGGIAAVCSERTVMPIDRLAIQKNGFYVMLDGIEDPYNFGYCLRSLYAAGVDGILLGPRNWMQAAGVVCRASAGASELLDVAEGEPEFIIDRFRAAGYRIIAADKSPRAVPIYDEEIHFPVLLVVGGEKRGITRAVLDRCNDVVFLDYGRRFGAALSAASAASVLAFEIFRQNRTARKNHD